MGPLGALIMSFFGAVFLVWASVLAAGWRTPLVIIPTIVFAGFVFTAGRKIKMADKDFYAPSKRASKVMSWSSAAEGVGVPIVAITLANTGHQSEVLPGIAAVVGLHFLPMAWWIPFRPLYLPAVGLLLASVLGFSIHQPLGSILAGVGGALTLWMASVLAIRRSPAGRQRPAA